MPEYCVVGVDYVTKADLTKELLVILDRYQTAINDIDEGDFSKLDRYHISDMITLELSKVYHGFKKMEKSFNMLEGLSRNMGRIK